MRGKRKYVVEAAVVGNQQLGTGTVDVLKAFDLHPGPAEPQVIP